MKRTGIALLISIILTGSASNGLSAESNWVGEYEAQNLLNGEAVFRLSIEQSGNAIHISFDAAYADAHGAAPDGGGEAKITGKNKLAFNWEDSFQNSGTGAIKRTGDGIIVSMEARHVEEPRCIMFYGENMRLKRVK